MRTFVRFQLTHLAREPTTKSIARSQLITLDLTPTFGLIINITFTDEAQVLPNIGQILKLMIDNIPELTIIAMGSSSFDLANKTGDPLTGRSIHYHLYPLSQTEISAGENALETTQNLEDRLIFGSYPELLQLTDTQEKSLYLLQLVQ